MTEEELTGKDGMERGKAENQRFSVADYGSKSGMTGVWLKPYSNYAEKR
ncbi:MAG: hypothetical protein K2H45_05245 [Acetatifactor sp.]|nr:hypothetical protein [Acetatifactor sp.]